MAMVDVTKEARVADLARKAKLAVVAGWSAEDVVAGVALRANKPVRARGDCTGFTCVRLRHADAATVDEARGVGGAEELRAIDETRGAGLGERRTNVIVAAKGRFTRATRAILGIGAAADVAGFAGRSRSHTAAGLSIAKEARLAATERAACFVEAR